MAEEEGIATAPSYTWYIMNFSKLTIDKLYSDIFVADGYKWRLLVYPKGNGVKHLSLYLDVPDFSTLPDGWSRNVESFNITVVNQICPKDSIKRDIEHERFDAKESDKGFDKFIPLADIHGPAKGYLVADTLIVEVRVSDSVESSSNLMIRSKNLLAELSSMNKSQSSCNPEAGLGLAKQMMQGTPDTRAVSLTATSMSGKSSSTLLENLKNLLAGFSSTKGTEKSTSSSNMSEGCLPPNPPSLQQHREVLKNYLALSLESIEQANAFDEIQRITLLLLQHSTSSLERTILKDLVSRLEAFKVIVPATKSSTENVRAQLKSLSGKKADVGARLGKAREHCDFLEAKFRKDSEKETEIEKQIVHLMKQKERLRISKNSLALELEKFSERVTKDTEEWKVISEESEEANRKWLQVRETLAQANLSWKLFKQNLEQCEKGA